MVFVVKNSLFQILFEMSLSKFTSSSQISSNEGSYVASTSQKRGRQVSFRGSTGWIVEKTKYPRFELIQAIRHKIFWPIVLQFSQTSSRNNCE